MKGYEGARAAKVDEVAVFAAASEAFSQKNINCSIAESLDRFRPLMDAARADGIPVRGYVSCVTDCPYSGAVPPEAAARVTEALFALGCYEVSLGDSIGMAAPEAVAAMLAKGNVATGRVVDYLARAGFATGIDRAGLAAAEAFVAGLALGETNRG